MTSRVPSRALFAAAFGVAALVPALALRGFTVDDALITARYAAHLAAGEGYRLNAGGPVTDGVTPLGFAFFLAPFAHGGALAALGWAKGLGVVAWTLASAVLGLAVRRVVAGDRAWHRDQAGDAGAGDAGEGEAIAPPRRQGVAPLPGLGVAAALIPLALIATSAPLGAWAASGMETGLVAALGALAVALPFLGRPLAGMACAGLAAGLRPELLPWAATLGFGFWLGGGAPSSYGAPRGQPPGERSPLTRGEEPSSARTWIAPLLVVAPFCAVAIVRLAVFGRPAPLSIFAKAPDARLGLLYAVACALLAGPPAIVAPRAFLRLPRFERALVASAFVHLVAIGLAGGDWMPLSRLVVPVLPTIALAALLLAQRAALPATCVRLALAVAGHTFVLVHVGPTAARVGADRLRVIDELRPAFTGARVVASLDIGWVGASTDATIVDLAGVTDPRIAALPGGHTTKQIPVGLLEARGVDTLVLLLAPEARVASPWTRSRFARGVEAWIATTPGVGDAFIPVAESTLPHLRYVVLRRPAPSRADALR